MCIQPGGDFRGRFEVLEELGKGRFGVVHKVIERDTGKILAGKIIKCIKAKDRVNVSASISSHQIILYISLHISLNRFKKKSR